MHLALGVEYDGGAFSGFQIQKSSPSVQAVLEQAFTHIADQPIRIVAAGRTDAGVHATQQVVGFSTAVVRSLDAWRRGVNSLTPAAVKVRWVQEVDVRFHARYSATARRYMYLWYEDSVRSPTLDSWAVHSRRLDDEHMHRASLALVGEHDFTSFRAAGCQSQSAHRCVHSISVQRFGSAVVLDITANECTSMHVFTTAQSHNFVTMALIKISNVITITCKSQLDPTLTDKCGRLLRLFEEFRLNQ